MYVSCGSIFSGRMHCYLFFFEKFATFHCIKSTKSSFSNIYSFDHFISEMPEVEINGNGSSIAIVSNKYHKISDSANYFDS